MARMLRRAVLVATTYLGASAYGLYKSEPKMPLSVFQTHAEYTQWLANRWCPRDPSTLTENSWVEAATWTFQYNYLCDRIYFVAVNDQDVGDDCGALKKALLSAHGLKIIMDMETSDIRKETQDYMRAHDLYYRDISAALFRYTPEDVLTLDKRSRNGFWPWNPPDLSDGSWPDGVIRVLHVEPVITAKKLVLFPVQQVAESLRSATRFERVFE